ncbi:MAG TPA: T9SS type A sorting domain-containing protein, partial [Bacteroidota bacterium]|nr:T9SS type A sorting domain-containing protein [Bacteroidota bacterium]
SYPNPFNPSSVVRFVLPARSHIRLAVYTILGQEVALLADGIVDAGSHEVRFDGSGKASGLYLARLTARPLDGHGTVSSATTRMLLVR